MKKTLLIIVWIAVIVVAVQFRSVGLYRGLTTGGIYHPDEPKQVLALWRYLNNKYLWHVGSLFYDGYPYGLNHVDEMVLRPVLAARKATNRFVDSERPVNTMLEVSDLYYLTRTLRVVYGMLAILLCLAASRKLSFSKSALWCVALFLAMAPISISVAHFATGDIGTNLFSALMLYFLCVYSGNHRGCWLFLAGMSVGMAFACKYNGVLAGGAVALYLVSNAVIYKDWKWFFRSSGILVVGVSLGIVLLTPALLLDWGQTNGDIVANFKFIRNYGAGSWWDEMSLPSQAGYVLFVTTPRIIGHIGWVVILSAIVGLFFSGREMIKMARRKIADVEARKAILTFSIFMYPFVALCLSISGKPEVQPFHFSYLQIPFVMGSVYGIGRIGRYAAKPMMRLAVLCLLIAAALELGLTAKRDAFFWARQDNNFITHTNPERLFTDKGRGVGALDTVRSVFLESQNAAVFRNRRDLFKMYGGAFWRDLKIAPVPSIPYPDNQDWIFANGPVFPRNERMFKVKRETCEEKHIVFHEKPTAVSIGLRSGSWPVEVRIEMGGVQETVRLVPNSQELISMTPERWRKLTSEKHDVFLVSLETEAVVGDAYVTVCVNSSDSAAFRVFGGDEDAALPGLPDGVSFEKLVSEVERTRYIESAEVEHRVLTASRSKDVKCVFPPRATHEPVSMPLPCGTFVFECEALVTSEKAEVLMQLDDARYQGVMTQAEQTIQLVKGHNVIKYVFSKKFAPYQCSIVMHCTEGTVRVGSWTLRPEVPPSLKLRRAGRDQPASSKNYAEPREGGDEDIVFGDALRMTRMSVPEELGVTDVLSLDCGMELTKYPFRDYGEYFVFIHLLDADGGQVFASGFPVARAVINDEQGSLIELGRLKGVVPGDYRLEMGVWNGRTRKRLNVSGASASDKNQSKSKIRIGKVRLK
jgi:hypothetical protein